MKHTLLHVMCHGVALGLIIAGGIMGYIYFIPLGVLFEIAFWFYAFTLARKRKADRMNELLGQTETISSSRHGGKKT